MPYIAYNGQLYEVSQTQYDSYTAGGPLPTGAVLTNPSNVAAGGTVTTNDTVTTPILTQNTTNNTPGQTLASTEVIATKSAEVTDINSTLSPGETIVPDSQVDKAPVSTNYGASTQVFDDGTTIQTFDDGSVLATSTDGTVTSSPSPTEDPQAIARAGLTTDQLALLGAADATDPYIRARLGLPALSEVQTLSGAIGNVSFGNVGSAVGNLVTSFGNAVGITNLSNVAGNLATSFGNAVSSIGDYISGNTSTTVAESAVNTSATATDSATTTQNLDNGTTVTTSADGATTTTTINASTVTSEPAPTNDANTTTVSDTGTVTSTNETGTVTTTPAPAGENIDTAPAPTNFATTTQTFDDGTTIQTFDDGSVLTTNTDNQVTATDAPVDNTEGYGQFTNAADAGALDTISTPADTNYGSSIQTFDDGTTLQTFDDGSVLATGTDGSVTATDAPVDPATDPQVGATQDAANAGSSGAAGDTNTGTGTSADNANALAGIQGQIQNAQAQATIASQRKQINNGDWRVRLRLAPLSNYLYNAPQPGILQPLKVTDGIIFPYTPQIDTSYRANYESYDLTHSNYRGYFYKNSYVDQISLKAQFTAQDTADANYLLAVITFLKSVTKMFYGQDSQRGAPPPLVYLTGLGEYQFNEHACVVSNFTYNLPDNVDYIRAGSPNQVGLNLTSIRDRQSVATNSVFGSLNRLAAAFLTKGAVTGAAPPPTLGLNSPTYVPTKIDINLTLLPIQSRQQVSKQFSVKEFASGNLIKGGFW